MLCINLKLKPMTIFSRNNATPRCGFLLYENGSEIDHAALFEDARGPENQKIMA
jgi:hypothetical protein